MLVFKNISLQRGSRILFQNASLTIHDGQKIGITGANGTGKSSLFSLIRNELQTDTGELSLPGNPVIAHVAQETPSVTTAALDYVMQGDQELHKIKQELHLAETHGNGEKQATLHVLLENIDGYSAESRASRLLYGLGFSKNQTLSPVHTFSGGWRMRLNLAQALMCRSDILLLDEPTNHLDLDAVIWLQEWLHSYQGTLMLISHDRDFLDDIVQYILQIENQSMTLYKGNYTSFEQQRTAQLAQQQSAYEKQQREIGHMQKFVERFRAKASKAKQAQSRLKSLEKLEKIAPAHIDSPFTFQLFIPEKNPCPLIKLEDISIAFTDKKVLSEINLVINPGDRIGLLGANGTGKSTLIKIIADEISLHSGIRHAAVDLKIGYFAQHQLEQLHSDTSPLQHFQQIAPKAGEKELRNFLGGFGFHGDTALEPIDTLSGGQKARLVLALIVYQKPNLLLLDEPTNHLDLDMRHALSVALQDYSGALVVVSHDRFLLRLVCDQFLLVGNQTISEFNGDLDDYRSHLLNAANVNKNSIDPLVSQQDKAIDRKFIRQQNAATRQRLKPLTNKIKKLEKELDQLNHDKKHIEIQLTDSTIYDKNNKTQLNELILEQNQLTQHIQSLEEQWLQSNEELEHLNDEISL